jgi:hypothetical protein
MCTVSFLLCQNIATAGGSGEGFETYINGLRYDSFSVENYNRKRRRRIWDDDIKVIILCFEIFLCF